MRKFWKRKKSKPAEPTISGRYRTVQHNKSLRSLPTPSGSAHWSFGLPPSQARGTSIRQTAVNHPEEDLTSEQWHARYWWV